MRPLGDYKWRDWQRLRPVTHWLKTRRYNTQREAYVRRAARTATAGLPSLRRRRVLTTIAFEDPEAIDMQAQLVARFVPDATYVVADMSTDEDAATQIGAIAERHGVAYVRLPENPLPRREQASRVHGLALNWVWRNLIRPGEPDRFGFIDHDMFPTEPDDPFAKLDRQPVYGCVREAEPRWYLWAGFAMFRFDAVKDLALDFGQDWFNGLDTGGANWDVLFRTLDRKQLKFARTRFEPYKPDADPIRAPIQWCGAWLHEVGSARREGDVKLAADKRRVIKEMLAPYLAPSAPREPYVRMPSRSN
jgi:hypothetical protein